MAVATMNGVLAQLSETDLQYVTRVGRVEPLRLRQPIETVGAPIERIYFPLDSVISLLTVMRDGDAVEIATIGRESMTGFAVLMDREQSLYEGVCQIDGHALSMTVEEFRRLIDGSESAKSVMMAALYRHVILLSQVAACNRLHSLSERAARWLLMESDRVASRTFPMTHEFLAHMLGTQRSNVTIVAGQLRKAGMIAYSRGKLTITDPASLEDAACECYQVAKQLFAETFESENALRSRAYSYVLPSMST